MATTIDTDDKVFVPAELHFTEEQIKEMKELSEIKTRMKALEARAGVLTDSIKKNMLDAKYKYVLVDGVDKFEIRTSERVTVTKKTKDDFVAQLVGMNRQDLVKTEITVDTESIFAEVDAGKLQKDFVDKYVKKTPVNSLYVNA